MKSFFFFKQKTAYEIKECDWSSDVCSSDLDGGAGVLRLYGNYGGDVMNFDMAGEVLEMEDIPDRKSVV